MAYLGNTNVIVLQQSQLSNQGYSQQYKKVPKTKFISVVYDTSGSMAGERIKNVCDQVEPLFKSLNPKDQVKSYGFSTSVQAMHDLIPVQRKNDELIQKIQSKLLASVGGGTALYDAIATVISEFPKSSQTRNCQIEFVILTDGEDNSSQKKLEEVSAMVRKPGVSNVHFTFVGVGMEKGVRGHPPLVELSKPEHCELILCGEKDVEIAQTFKKITTDVAHRGAQFGHSIVVASNQFHGGHIQHGQQVKQGYRRKFQK